MDTSPKFEVPNNRILGTNLTNAMLDPRSSYWNCQPSSFARCFIILFSFLSMCKSLGWYYSGQGCWLAKVVPWLCRDCGIKHCVSHLTVVCRGEWSGEQVMENTGWDTLDWDTTCVLEGCVYMLVGGVLCCMCVYMWVLMWVCIFAY